MIPVAKHKLLYELERLCELRPEIRFGQLLDYLGVLSDDRTDRSLAVIEDEELLGVVQSHLAEMSHQHPNVA